MKACVFCGATDRELRPYGPSGAGLCFDCMKASPERERAAGAAFMAIVDANIAVSPVGAALLRDGEIAPIDVPQPDDLSYDAWCVIANARDWLLDDQQSREWREAAIRWRNRWHSTLNGAPE